MKQRISIGVFLIFFAVVAGAIAEEAGPDCVKQNKQERWAIRGDFDREASACKTDQCQKKASAKYSARSRELSAHQAACDAYLRGHQPAPQSPATWKPGDPSPVAPDGRRYMMSCSGKVVGLYRPGEAVEMELKTHPGNCVPNDNPWPGPGNVKGPRQAKCYVGPTHEPKYETSECP
jgi:hypothetical protein